MLLLPAVVLLLLLRWRRAVVVVVLLSWVSRHGGEHVRVIALGGGRARRPGVKSEVGKVALGQQGASYR